MKNEMTEKPTRLGLFAVRSFGAEAPVKCFTFFWDHGRRVWVRGLKMGVCPWKLSCCGVRGRLGFHKHKNQKGVLLAWKHMETSIYQILIIMCFMQACCIYLFALPVEAFCGQSSDRFV